MKRKLFLAIAIGAMALTACNKEDCGDTFLRNETLSASLVDETAQTRTALNGLQVVWSANDKISVFAENGNSVSNNAGIIKTGVGTTSATFDVVLEGTTKLAAAYPYMDGTTYANGTITMNMPDSYTYVENGIGGAPMAAIISNQTSTIAFKNAGALMGLTVNNIPAGFNKAILTSKGDEAITGTCEIKFDADSKPSIEATDAATGKVITINFDAAQTATNKTFYFPIPVGEYSSLELSISDGTETKVLKTKGLKAERSQRYKSTLTLDVVSGETPVEASSAEDASSKLQNSNSVNVTIPEDEDDPTILLPETNNDGPTTLSFEPIPDGKTVTILATSDETNVSDDVNIAASSNGDSQNNNFNIQLPNSTVTLNANGDAATYNNVTAHTAANTLIIGKGVTVNNLVVEGGNVRVYGEVKNISRANNNDEVTVIFVEDGGIIPASIGEGFVVIYDESKWDGTSCYAPQYDEENKVYNITNGYELAWIANYVNKGNTLAGCTIALNNDIDLNNKNWTPIGFNSKDEAGDEPYFAGTFDGNGKTINNLCIDLKDQGGVGLFGVVNGGASFKNFTLNNVNIKAVESEDDPANTSGAEGKAAYIVGGHIGAVVGYSKGGTVSFENVHIKGLIKIEGETRAAQGQRIGGIVGGRSNDKYTFDNVSVIGDASSYIKGYCSTAGVLGQNQGGAATFNNVHTNIDIYAVTFGAGGIAGIAKKGSTFTNCSAGGNINLDAETMQPAKYSANYPYRIGGIAGCWSDESKTGVLTLTGCSFTGTLTSIDKNGNSPSTYDYSGLVGRGYTLTNCAGSKVIIDGVEYVQAYDKEYGVYTIDGVYEMKTLADMQWLANKVNTGADYFEGKTIKLVNDIDLNNVEWTPIGSASMDHGFMGNFDGNGKTIKNLNISNITLDSDGYAYAGLFSVTEGTDKDNQNYIKNLTIENVNISTEGHIVAAAIAYPYYTTVENITVKGDINIKGGDYTAGILAYTRRCVDAKNLTIAGNTGSSITGRHTVGGVISDIQTNGGLTANYSNFAASGLTIQGVKCVGGISGIISKQTLDGATVKNVTIVSEDARTGIVSGADGGKSTITNVSYENVTGATRVIGATYDKGYYIGQIVECAGQKAIIYSINDGVKAVSVEEKNLNGVYATDAATWAEGLGEGWSLASIYDLDAIHKARFALNDALEADSADNALFCETEYYVDGKYALYISSTVAEGNDPQGEAYLANRVHVKYFNLNGYWDYNYSTFATISKYAPLRGNYFARAVYNLPVK